MTTAKNALFTFMKDRWKLFVDIPEPEFTAYAEKRFNDQMTQYVSIAKKVMESYIEIASIDLRPLKNAYGELDFLFANRKLRKWISEGIHIRLLSYEREVASQAYYFKLFLSGNMDNFVEMLDKIDELQKKYFSMDEKSDGNHSIITIYGKFADSMDECIEKLRCRMYGQRYSQNEHMPIAEYHIQRKAALPTLILKKKT